MKNSTLLALLAFGSLTILILWPSSEEVDGVGYGTALGRDVPAARARSSSNNNNNKAAPGSSTSNNNNSNKNAAVIQSSKRSGAPIKSRVLTIDDTNYVSVIVSEPEKVDRTKPFVVLLHGATLNATTWVDLGTVELLTDAGFRVYAINLPGVQGTSTPLVRVDSWLGSLFNLFLMWPAVIVAPSMGGAYALPLVAQLGHSSHSSVSPLVVGLVTLAPIMVREYALALEQFKHPALVFVGDQDPMAREALPYLERIPAHTTHIIEKGSHGWYLERPDEFHALLLKFLKNLPLTYNPN